MSKRCGRSSRTCAPGLGDPLLVVSDGAPGIIRAIEECGTVGNLVRGAGFPSGSDEAIAEHDGELGLSLGPFAGRHFPLLSDPAQDQENELVAASSLGKWPLARTARRSLAFKASIAFVV